MILSDISNAALGAWVYGLATIIQIAATVTVLITINSKQKREVSFAGTPVDKEECEARHADLKLESAKRLDEICGDLKQIKADQKLVWAKMESDAKEIQRTNEVRAHDVHLRLNPAAEDIAAVKGQMSAFTASFENFARMIVALAQNKKL